MAPQPSLAGTFPVCLPGYLELDANDFHRICAVHPYDVGDGSYIVEFQVQQDAARYLKAARKARKEMAKSCAAVMKGDEAVWPSPCGFLGQPQPANGQDLPEVVEVRDLPKHLLSQTMLEATLEQAGLEKDVCSIKFVSAGKVQITLSSRCKAEICLEHFHGRKWNPTGSAVSAKIMERTTNSTGTHGSLTISTKPDPVMRSLSSSSGFSKYAPAYVHSSFAKDPVHEDQPRDASTTASLPDMFGTSDASTTVSDEDQEESWEADLKKVMEGCAFE